MKKAAFLALIVCGLVASFLVGNSLSQQQIQPSPLPDRVDPIQPSREVLPVRPNIVLIDDVSPRIEALREELLELTQQRSKGMSEDQLKAEVSRLQKELSEQRAEAKLREAQGLLSEIVKDFPESQAARHAGRMLQVPKSGGGGGAFGPGGGFGGLPRPSAAGVGGFAPGGAAGGGTPFEAPASEE